MFLAEVLDEVMLQRDLQPITEAQYRKSIECFSAFLQRPAEVTDLNYNSINNWLKSLKQEFEPVTIRNRKRGITVVWNYLADLGKVEHLQSRRLFCPKVVDKPVVSWTLSEFDKLVLASKKLQGTIEGMSASEFMEAWLWVGLDTAFRPSDMRLLRWSEVDLRAQCITITQHKTSVVHNACLSDESVRCLKTIRYPARDLVFPVDKDQLRSPLKKLYKIAAEVGFIKKVGRSIGTLRRLHATIQYEDHGESVAAESLGHIGGVRTVLKSYVDHRSRKQGRIPRHAENPIKSTSPGERAS